MEMMHKKHWHLTENPGPGNEDHRGGRICLRKYADHLARQCRQRTGRPMYVETCTANCGPAGQPYRLQTTGRPLIEMLADDEADD